MARLTHRYHHPDRFVAGALGEPGNRTFHLQVRQANHLTTVRCHKDQLVVLAEHLHRILDELTRQGGDHLDIPTAARTTPDEDPLDLPLDDEFEVATVVLSWDSVHDKVQIELLSPEVDEPAPTEHTVADGSESAESLDVRLDPAQARRFAVGAQAVVAAGRPACPFCAQPVNPRGHLCPRTNGYHRPVWWQVGR